MAAYRETADPKELDYSESLKDRHDVGSARRDIVQTIRVHYGAAEPSGDPELAADEQAEHERLRKRVGDRLGR
jgi:hypothetical protein